MERVLFYGRLSPGLDDYFLAFLRDDLTGLQTTFDTHERYQNFSEIISTFFAIYYLLSVKNAAHRIQTADDHHFAIEARIHDNRRHQLESVGPVHLVRR